MIAATAMTMSLLIAALEGVGPSREAAIDSLAGKPDSFLVSVMDSVNWRGRDAVVSAMERSEPARIRMLMELASGDARVATRRSAIRSLGRVGPRVTCDSLIALLGSGSDAVILDAVKGRKDCRAGAISPYLKSDDRDSRRRAFIALAETDSLDLRETAIAMLDDPDHGVRAVASDYLSTSGGATMVAVAEAVDGLGEAGRTTALRILGRASADNEEALLRLGLALLSNVWQDRRMAALSLGGIGNSKSLNALRSRLANETHTLVREALNAAIQRIESKVE